MLSTEISELKLGFKRRMTQTTTDYLFQLAAPATDRAYASPTPSASESSFDNHLTEASTRGTPRTDSSHYDESDSSHTSYDNDRTRSSSEAAPATRPSDNTTADDTSAANHDDSSDVAKVKNGHSDGTPRDECETDKTEDTSTAAVAAAGSTASNQSQQQNVKQTRHADSSVQANAKANTTKEKLQAAAHEEGVANSRQQTAAADAQSTETVTNLDTAATIVDATDAQSKAGTNAGLVSEAAEQTPKSKAPANGASRPNTETNAEPTDSESSTKQSQVLPTDNLDVAVRAAQKGNDGTQRNSNLSAVPSQDNGSDRPDGTEDDSSGDSHTDTRSTNHGDASAKLNQAEVAAIATGPGPISGDAAANDSSKTGKSDSSAKPVAAVGDTSAASLARFNRLNSGITFSGQNAANDAASIDPARFVGRVAKAFQTAQDRGGTLQLRLSPPELGSLRLELTVKDGVMSAALQTETASARRLLLDHLPALRDRLAEQNIRVDRFDVDVRREGGGGQTDTRGSQQQAFQHQPDQPTPRRQAPALQPQGDAQPDETLSSNPIVSDAGLNLIV
jgi:flagellar hook-length control protein FliK